MQGANALEIGQVSKTGVREEGDAETDPPERRSDEFSVVGEAGFELCGVCL